jgi:hypothetical protein
MGGVLEAVAEYTVEAMWAIQMRAIVVREVRWRSSAAARRMSGLV